VKELSEILGVSKPLIAMCHLRALPGRPQHDRNGGMQAVLEPLKADVDALQRAGVDALLFCNESDLPYQRRTGPEVAAAMAAMIGELRPRLSVPHGVDVLWDPYASLAIARATQAVFVREVFTGVFESDMGLLAPDFGEIAAYRTAIGAPDVAIFANITPEFSRSVSNRPVAERAKGAEYMGVEALLISGPAAGVGVNLQDLRDSRAALKEAPILANTGVRHDTVAEILSIADGAVVGTSLKVDGVTWNPVEESRAREMVKVFRESRSSAA
jgi:membrane complex biogenesis BtpA family protein